MAKVRRMFPGGNTSEGFYSYHKYITKDTPKRMFILKGGPGSGKSTIMKQIGQKFYKKGYCIEYHHCPSDSDSVDGIVIVDADIAVIDGTAPHMIDPIMPGLLDEIVDLGKYIDESKVTKNKDVILKAKHENKSSYRSAYSFFSAGREILNEIAENNKERMEFGKVNKISCEILEEIFKDKKTYLEVGNARHLFNRALTPQGLTDYTETLINDIEYIYYLKGDYGTGKSTLLRRVSEEATLRGYDVEVFHQPLIPQKINSIVLPQLSLLIITDEIDVKIQREVIDLDDYLKEKIDLVESYNIFECLIGKGIEYLKNAKANHDILEKYYHEAIDFDGIEKEKEKLIEKINILI